MACTRRRSARPAWLLIAALLVLLVTGCTKELPPGRYAVDDVQLENVSSIDRDDLLDRLATAASPRFLGLFEGVVYDYEIFDKNLLSKDLERVERYLRAHGYYEAKVRAARVIPRDRDVLVVIEVSMGVRVYVKSVTEKGLASLPFKVAAAGNEAVSLRIGDPFDEDEFERSKKLLISALADHGYAFAKVKASAHVDIAQHSAQVVYTVTPGPPAVYGAVKIVGLHEVPEGPVRANLAIKQGEPYSRADLGEAQDTLINLGVFGSVDVQQDLDHPETRTVPITVVVHESTMRAVRLGGGVRADALRIATHLVTGWEDRNFLGGMRHFSVDARPGVTYFPATLYSIVRPTKLLLEDYARAELRQPSFLEGRTTGILASEYNVYPLLWVDMSPDDKVIGYQELRESAAIERAFFGLHLLVNLSYHWQANFPFMYQSDKPPGLESVRVSYPELVTNLDFRDNRIEPHSGFLLSNSLQVAGLPYGGTVKDVRLRPEIRAYVTRAHLTLAIRVTAGMLFPVDYGETLQDPALRDDAFNPATVRDQHKLLFRAFYSGGPNSNRGYPYREVGPHGAVGFLVPNGVNCTAAVNRDIVQCQRPLGGLTLWEASMEVRFPISGPVSGAVFTDASDVSLGRAEFDFNYPHLSPGLGLRYDTPIGPIRADLGVPARPVLQAGPVAPGRGPPREVPGRRADQPQHRARRGLLMAVRRGARRVAHAFVRVVEGALLVALFAATLVVGLLLHLDLPAGRRVAARTLSRVLGNLFYGDVHVGALAHFDPYSVVATDIDVHDPDGKLVLHVSKLTARADLPDIIEDLLFDTGKVTIIVRYVRVEDAEGQILPDPGTGIPSIARAFTLRPSAPSAKPSTPPTTPARTIRVWLPDVEIGHAFARGTVAGLPTMETQLANVKGSILGTPKGVAVDVQRFGTVVRGLGGADARGTGTLHIRAPGAIWTGFDGYFGDVEIGAFARVDGKRLSASVDMPRAKPEAVRALFPDYPLHENVTAHVEAAGTLPVLDTKASFEIGRARVSAVGPLRLSGTVGANLDVEARNVDLRALFPSAPRSDLSADSAVSIWNKHGQVVVDVNGTSQPGSIAGQDIPAVDVLGTWNEIGFKGTATLHERGLPVKADVLVAKNGDVDVDARARSFSIQGAPRLAQYTSATGIADVRVTAHIAGPRVEANVSGDFKRLALGDVRLGSGHLSGRATGPLTHPDQLDINAKLTGKELNAGMFSFGRFQAQAVGPVRRPHVKTVLDDDYGPKVTASGLVTTIGKPAVHDLSLEVKRDQATLTGRVAALELGSGSVEIEKLHLDGAGGSLDGSAHIRPGLFQVNASGHDLDLDVIARAIGLPRGVLGGKLRVDADVTASRELSRGKVRLALGNGSVMGLEGISLDVHADLDGTAFNGGASVLLRDIGAFGALWESQLAGPLQKVASWRGIVGQTNVQMSGVSLDGLERLLPASLHLDKISGVASGKLIVDRHAPDAVPDLFTLVETHGLVVVPTPAKGAKAQPITGVDVQLGGNVNGATGDTWLTSRLIYDRSILAAATSTLRVDLRRMIAHPDQIVSQLSTTPIDAVLAVDKRDLSAFPPLLQLPGLQGAVGGRITLSGTPARAGVRRDHRRRAPDRGRRRATARRWMSTPARATSAAPASTAAPPRRPSPAFGSRSSSHAARPSGRICSPAASSVTRAGPAVDSWRSSACRSPSWACSRTRASVAS